MLKISKFLNSYKKPKYFMLEVLLKDEISENNKISYEKYLDNFIESI